MAGTTGLTDQQIADMAISGAADTSGESASPTSAAPASSASGTGGMLNQADFYDMASRHGGIVGTTSMPGTKDPLTGLPDPNPPVKVTFKDGTYFIGTYAPGTSPDQSDSTWNVTNPGTAIKAGGATGDKVLASASNPNDQYIVTTSADGTTKIVPNPNYVPPKATPTISVPDPNHPGQMIDVTPAEAQAINTSQRNQNTADYQDQRAAIAQQTNDLRAAAQDKSNQIAMMNVDNATKTRLFDEWWQQNVTGPKTQLDAQATMYNTALTAGNDAVNAAQMGTANAVGPNFGADFANVLNATASGTRATGGFGAGDFTYQRPDYAAIAQKATAQALAHLSPFAAQIAGAPTPSGYQPQQPVLTQAANNVVAGQQQQAPVAPAPQTAGNNVMSGLPYRPGG